MSLWRQITRGLRALANRQAADRDIADESSTTSRRRWRRFGRMDCRRRPHDVPHGWSVAP
jgi:hypothetical protein